MRTCSMCTFTNDDRNTLLSHVVRKHRHNPNFRVQCQVEGCGITYSKWASFKKHLTRKHQDAVPRQLIEQQPLQDNEPYAVNAHVVDEGHVADEEVVDAGVFPLNDGNPANPDMHLWTAAKFLLTLREEANMTQRAIGMTVDGIDDLFKTYLDKIHAKLRTQADPATGVITPEVMDEIMRESKSTSVLEGVSSKYLMDKFINAAGGLHPEKVLLGTQPRWTQTTPPSIVDENVYAYVVLLSKSLKQLLMHNEILNYVENPPVRINDGIIRDERDSSWYRNHPILSTDPTALYIIFYYDLQTSNPLGSKKRKYSMFYYTLGIVPPRLRSSLRAINVFGIVETCYLKKMRVSKVLSSLVGDIKQLESPEGLTFELKGQLKTFRGALFLVTADTPAAQSLGGFKESVGKAQAPCRSCMATHTTRQTNFLESDFVLRDRDTHRDYVSRVTDMNISKETAITRSREFGVTGPSALSEIEHFDVTKCLVHDLMHVCREGILPLEIRLLLQYVINERKLITRKLLNHLMLSFNYKHLKKDRPSEIEKPHLENNLRQNSSQILVLGHVLPFLLKRYVESDPSAQERLLLLVKLTQLINLALSFEFSVDGIAMMEMMIKSHHTNFKRLYPEIALTPKFHFLIHLPRQIVQFGPLRHHWCLRFEGRHAYFKRLMGIVLSYKNAPYTVLYRHCSQRTAQLLTFPGHIASNFLDIGDEVQRGPTMEVISHPNRDLLKLCVPVLTNNDLIMLSKNVKVRGTEYTKNSIILLNWADDDLLPLDVLIL